MRDCSLVHSEFRAIHARRQEQIIRVCASRRSGESGYTPGKSLNDDGRQDEQRAPTSTIIRTSLTASCFLLTPGAAARAAVRRG
jgi:hypothetical protein